MMITKEKAMRLLDEEYDKWRNIEEHNENVGIGRMGANGILSNFEIYELLNEILVRFEYNIYDIYDR